MKKSITCCVLGILTLLATPLFAKPTELKWAQLSPVHQQLIDKARSTMKDAYAPYSHYHVGAALLSESGKIYTGFNIENASYPLGMCAERTALFKAITLRDKRFKTIAIVTRDGGMPCGACRQTLNEFAPNLEVLVTDQNKQRIQKTTLAQLLPESFGPSNLNSEKS